MATPLGFYDSWCVMRGAVCVKMVALKELPPDLVMVLVVISRRLWALYFVSREGPARACRFIVHTASQGAGDRVTKRPWLRACA